jgi:lysophospholipase L1-like esterase
MNTSSKTTLLLSFIFISLATLANCQSTNKPENQPSEPLRYLALGDSYTIGTAIDQENSYPNQLADTLISKGIEIETPQIIATNGWTTTDLKEGIQEAQPDSNFDMVSLLIGVNNQYQGKDIGLYRTEFRELLEKAISFAGGNADHVFVISIPNYGVTPFASSRNPEKIRTELQNYDRIAKEISSEYDIPFINITPISELAADDLSLLATDELHPSAKMYSMWIGEMLPNVNKIIEP